MTRTLGSAVLKLMGLVLVIHGLTFYLDLGYYFPALVGIGALPGLAVTSPEWKRASLPLAAAGAVVTGYALMHVVVLRAGTSETLVDRPMSWSVRSAPSESRGPEVVLEFEDAPGNLVGFYSVQLADYLRSTAQDRLDVEFAVTRDFGCLRGFHATRVGALSSWEAGAAGYAGSSGTAGPAWPDPWWCP